MFLPSNCDDIDLGSSGAAVQVFYCLLAGLGLTGNVVAAAVFAMPHMANAFNRTLLFLAAFEAGFVVFTLIDVAIIFAEANVAFVLLFPKILHPLQQIFWTASLYMIVAIAVDRYMAVTKPFEKRIGLKEEKLEIRTANLMGLSVLLSSSLYSLPHFFEYEAASVNGTQVVRDTAFREKKVFSLVYTVCVDSLMSAVLPMSILLLTNARIFCVMRSSSPLRKAETFACASLLTLVLLAASSTCGLVYNVARHWFDHDHRNVSCPTHEWMQYLFLVTKFLILLNCSVNFVVHAIVGAKFRAALKCLFCKCAKADLIASRPSA